MRISQGQPLSYSPDSSGFRAQFKDNVSGDVWDQPVVGFAVVVRWAGWEDGDAPAEDQDLAETSIVPVTFDQGRLITAADYADDRADVSFLGLLEP